METNTRRPVAPFYAVAVIWLVYALLFPLYAPLHYVLLTAVSAAVFFIAAPSAGAMAASSDTAYSTMPLS